MGTARPRGGYRCPGRENTCGPRSVDGAFTVRNVRVLGTFASVLVGTGHVLDSGRGLFGLSSFFVDVVLGAVVGAVTGVAQTGLSLLHVILPQLPSLSMPVTLGVTVLAGPAALLVGATVRWQRPTQP